MFFLFLSESDLLKISVLWSPAGPLLRLANKLHSEAGSGWAHGVGRPFPASSRGVGPGHSGGPSGPQRGHPDGAPGQALARGLRPLGGPRWARGAGCAEEGAHGRAHSAGRAELGAERLQHHGQVARSRRPARPAASTQGVQPTSPAPSSSWSIHSAASRPFPRRLRLTSSASREALVTYCQVQRKCSRHRGKLLPRPFKTFPLLPPPEPRHSTTDQLGSVALRLHHFLLCPPRGRDACSLGSVERIPSRLQRPTSRLQARGVRRGEWGDNGEGGWVAGLLLPVSALAAAAPGPRGLGRCWGARAQAAPGELGKSHRPVAGAGGSRLQHSLLGRRALQPWLKPTDENPERAAKS